MKRSFAVFALIMGAIYAHAQTETRLGGYLGYGSEIETLGIGFNAEIMLSDKFAIAPGITFFFPNSEGNTDVRWFELNANVNYYFLQEKSVSLYGLGGLNFTNVKVDYDGPAGEFSNSDTEMGLNLGIGANFDVGKNFMPFTELKFVVGDADQVCLFFGLKFNLK